jgi:hypothetical protein
MKKLLIIVLILGFVISIGFNVLGAYERFNITKGVEWEGHTVGNNVLYIAKDKKTNVCYLVLYGGNKCAMTVMYDSLGHVLVEK